MEQNNGGGRTNAFGKKQLLLKCCVLYIAILLLALPLIPIWQSVLAMSRESVLRENHVHLESGMMQINAEVAKLHDNAALLLQSESILSLALWRDTLPVNRYMNIFYARKEIARLMSLQNGVVGQYVLFRNNDIIVSDSFASADYRSVYDGRIAFPGLSAEAWHDMVFAQDGSIALLPSVAHAGMQIVPCVIRYQNRSCALYYLVDARRWMDMLCTDELYALGQVAVTDRGGDAILLHGENATALLTDGRQDQDAIVIGPEALHIADSFIQVTVSLPEALVMEKAQTAVQLIRWYLLALLTSSVLLTIFYTLRHFNLISRLVRTGTQQPPKRRLQFPAIGEYDYVADVIDQLANARDERERQLALIESAYQISLLQNAFLHGLTTPTDQRRFTVLVGEHAGYFCVAVFRTEGESDPAYMLRLEEGLRAEAGFSFLSVPISAVELVVLMRLDRAAEQPDALQALRRPVDHLAGAMDRIPEVGVSAPFGDLRQVHAHYEQAVCALRLGEAGRIAVFEEPAFAGRIDRQLPLRLYELALTADASGITQAFEALNDLRAPALGMQWHMRLFYLLQNALENVYASLGLTDPLPEYMADASFSGLMDALQAGFLRACRAVEERKKSRNGALADRLYGIMREQFSNPALTVAMLAEAAGISEKYAYQFIREQMGRTPSEWIEQERLCHAEVLLTQSDKSNAEIAQAAGFGSMNTFYRAFKKKHGVTPGAWRDARQM